MNTETPSLVAEHFDGIFAASDDPWGFRERWYEQRKRALTLACLPRARFRRGLEIGCASGELTAALAERCDRLLACDMHPRAIELTRRRVAAFSQVEVERRQLPEQWPEGRFDLVVIAEVAYFLTSAQRRRLLECLKNSLASDGVMLACHWRWPFDDAQCDAATAHRDLASLSLNQVLKHEEPDFLLDVWSADEKSVAQAEGLVPMTSQPA